MNEPKQMTSDAPDTIHSLRAERTRRLKRTFVTSVLMRPLALVTPFVVAPLFLRYLGEERNGLYGTIISMAGLIGMSNAGLTLGLINKLTDCHVSGDKLLARRYVSSLSMALLMIAFTGTVLASMVIPFIPWKSLLKIESARAASETPWAVGLTAIFTLLGVASGVPRAVYTAYQDLEINNYWDGASKVVVLLACFLAVYMPFGLIGVAFAVVGVPTLMRIVNNFSLFFIEKPWLRPSLKLFETALIRSVMVQGVCLFILEVAMWALFASDNTLISMLIGPKYVTNYDLLGRLFATSYGVFLMALMPLWPAYGEAVRRGDFVWVKRGVKLSLIVVCGGMISVGLVLYFFDAFIFRHWMHQPITVSRSLVLAMTATFVLRGWVDCRSMVLNPANILWPQIWFFAVHAVLNIVGALVLAPRMGVEGVAWATPLAALLTSAWGYPWLMHRFFRRAESGQPMPGTDSPRIPGVVLPEMDLSN